MTPADHISEAEFQATVVEMGQLFGWLVAWNNDSRRSRPGIPDLLMAKPPLVFAPELKREKGKLRPGRWNKKGTEWFPGQEEWNEVLSQCTVFKGGLYRPSDGDEIETILKGVTP